ncbi:MAG: polyprenol phosphomannose-dependent alpha 1,6 mannosyltransferase MptB [Solirubrobacterales bacterium]
MPARLRRPIGIAALIALAALAAALAAAGPDVVPASGRGGDPGWLDGVYGDGFGISGGAYIHLERAALVAYVAVIACASAIPRRLLWGVTATALAAFALSPPLLSLDVFSYVSYARLAGEHGLNPYSSAPSAVPGDPALALVEDWRESVSVYGPLFTLLTAPLGKLSVGAAVWLLKAAAGLSVAAIAWIVARLAALRGVDPRFAVALVALNPLVLVHVVGGAHNDALMAALMMLAVAGVVTGRQLLGGIGVAAAAAVKASALMLVPFALLGAERRGRLLTGMAIGAAALIGAGLAAFGSSLDEAAKVVGQNQGLTSRASVPGTLSRELGLDLDAVRAVFLTAFALVLAGLLAWVARGADWVRGTGWGVFALLVATSYLTPWYAIWALPHAALARDRALAVSMVLLSAFLLRDQVPGLGG